MNKDIIKYAALLVGGLAVGYGAGFIITKQRVEARANADIESVKEHYKLLHKEGEYATPAAALKVRQPKFQPLDEVKDRLVELGYSSVAVDIATEAAVTAVAETVATVFDENIPSDADLGEEITVFSQLLEARNVDMPYVVSIDEFNQGIDDYDKVTFTYFEDDDILVDERDSIVPDIEAVLGTALSYFGAGSGSEDVVYVCNESIGMYFEVIRDPRAYVEAVANQPGWDAMHIGEAKPSLKMKRSHD